MDRVQFLLLGFPLFLFCSDLVSLFSTPPQPAKPLGPRQQYQPPAQQRQQPPEFPASPVHVRGPGYGAIIEIKFCSSCSYRGTAVTMKKMLEGSFPGMEVILSNYPPTLLKRLLTKLVSVAQFGVIALMMAGEQIFLKLGMPPPQWYHQLRANRFGTMATTWLLGNFAQSFLQSSGAFEVYCNNDLIFSKLREHRFPSEFELRQAIASRLPESAAFGRNLDSIWS